MSFINLYDDHINTYNMIKQTLFKIFVQLRCLKKYLKYFINQNIYLLLMQIFTQCTVIDLCFELSS